MGNCRSSPQSRVWERVLTCAGSADIDDEYAEAMERQVVSLVDKNDRRAVLDGVCAENGAQGPASV